MSSPRRKGKRLIYWDSCIFIAWIKDEPQPELIKKGIEQTIERAYRNEIVIMTSTLALSEVLQTRLDAAQKERYRRVFHHPSLQLIDVDRRVAEYSAVIRERYDTRKFDREGKVTGGSFMSLGDAVHVATAIHFNADEMHTLDGSGKRQRKLDLLSLNGNVADRTLVIVKPYYIAPPPPLEPSTATLEHAKQIALQYDPPDEKTSGESNERAGTSDIKNEPNR